MIASQVHLDVQQVDHGITVVRPVGRLDLSSYAELRDELLKVASAEPPAVVIRVDEEFEATTLPILAVFTTVWLKVSEWPGVPILLVTETSRHAHDLRRSGVPRFVPTFTALRPAIESIGRPAARRIDRVTLPASPAAPLIARAFVRTAGERWQVPAIIDDAVLIASELVENAVRHAESSSVLRLELRPNALSISVRDASPHPPVRLGPGHGVDIVERMSRSYGWSPCGDGGKVVWAVLAHP